MSREPIFNYWLLITLVFFIGSASVASAQEGQRSPAYYRAMNNLAHEHAECAAYYAIATKCFGPKLDDTTRTSATEAGIAAITRGTQYTAEARLKPETFMARMKMSAGSQAKLMGDNCSNISLVMVSFAERCKALLEDPVPTFERYLDQALAEEPKK